MPQLLGRRLTAPDSTSAHEPAAANLWPPSSAAIPIRESRSGLRAEGPLAHALHALPGSLARAPHHTTLESALDWATQELGTHFGFDRVMAMTVQESVLTIRNTYFRGAANLASEAHANASRYPIELTPARLETEMLRRRAPALVDIRDDDRAWHPIVDNINAVVYVATPILAFDRVVATVHGDVFYSGELPAAEHRDSLAVFATMCGSVLERALLMTQLTELRRSVRTNASQMLALAAAEALPDTQPAPVPGQNPRLERTDPLPLTRREIEVLTLMAHGATSAQIARRLVIAPDTVKTHSKNILRKLGASTRAEAVARFMRD